MGDACVDLGKNGRLEDEAHVDAGGRAAKVEGGQAVRAALAGGDLVHPARGAKRVGGCAADELDDRRRPAHGERADARRLRDRAVADVRVGVVRAEAREIEAHRCQGGGGEPAIAEAAHADAEVCAVARHRRHEGRPRHAVGGVRRRLARRHAEIQEEVLVAGCEGEDARALGGREIERRDFRRQQLHQQRGGRAVPIVALVAHLERLGDQRPHVHAAGAPDRLAECSTEHVAEPDEAIEDVGSVGAVAEGLAEALVDGRPGVVAVGTVLDDEDGHRGRDDTGHRPDRPVMMAG